jgi:hypothetical protein
MFQITMMIMTAHVVLRENQDMLVNLIFIDPCIVVCISRNNQQDATL